MSNDIRRQLDVYGDYIDSGRPSIAPETIIERAPTPPARGRMNPVADISQRKARVVALAVGAVAITLLVAGPVLLAGRGDPQSGPVATVGSGSDCPWASTTVTIAVGGPVCPTPETAEERALAAAYAILGTERFAGMWYDVGTSDLVLGYVGEAPDPAQLPEFDEFVERDRSLADMQAEATDKNAADGEDSGHWWMVDVDDGVVVSIDVREEYAGQFIRAREACSTAVARWAEAVATGSMPDYYAASWERGATEVLYLECRDDATGQWAEWHVLHSGVVPAEDDPNPPGSDL